MAHLFQPKYTRPIPHGANFTTKNGVPYVSWKDARGRTIFAPVLKSNHKRCTIQTECWWVEYRDHDGKVCREQCYADRRASEEKMREIERRIAAIRAGDISPASQKRAGKLLADLIQEFADSMAADDTSPMQIKIVTSRIAKVADEIQATKPADFTTAVVTRALRHFRETRLKFSPETSNHYLRNVHQFILWCVRRGYLDADPLRDAKVIEVHSRRTFERRALTVEEIRRLLDATLTHRQPLCPLDGPDRAALYATAIYTGLRVGELASLTKASFQLGGTVPLISVHGRSTKNKKPRHQPIPPEIAERLRPWLAEKTPVRPVWAGYRWRTGKAAAMLRRDLEAAGIPADTPEGRVDFHSLRTTYGTLLALAGVPIQHAQRLMDHSDPSLTARHYTKLRASDLADQVGKMELP
jgi:integrase